MTTTQAARIDSAEGAHGTAQALHRATSIALDASDNGPVALLRAQIAHKAAARGLAMARAALHSAYAATYGPEPIGV